MVPDKELDLRRLWKEVQALGGYETCTTKQQWAKVAGSLGLDHSSATESGSLLRYAPSPLQGSAHNESAHRRATGKVVCLVLRMMASRQLRGVQFPGW